MSQDLSLVYSRLFSMLAWQIATAPLFLILVAQFGRLCADGSCFVQRSSPYSRPQILHHFPWNMIYFGITICLYCLYIFHDLTVTLGKLLKFPNNPLIINPLSKDPMLQALLALKGCRRFTGGRIGVGLVAQLLQGGFHPPCRVPWQLNQGETTVIGDRVISWS